VPSGKKHDFIKKKIDEIKKQREKRYESICKILAQNDKELSEDSLEEKEPGALKRLRDSFNRLNTLLAEEKKLKPEAFNDLKDEFCNLIQDKLNWFKKEKNKELYNQNGIYFNPMPNFWDDVPAVKEFRESFCDDINLRHSKNGKKVVDVLYKYFEMEKGEMDLNKKLDEWEKYDTEPFKPKG
jgi:septum formation topological specificity factor MinE